MRKMAVSKDPKNYHTYFVEEDSDNNGLTTWYVFENEEDENPKYVLTGSTRFLSLFDLVL